ncbi:AAA family ATPase [Pirellulales bacterium]|nr:AAA family ATPase [Pirellulales bacterium]
MVIERHLTQKVLEALKDTPVVYIQGAGQTGKSTLVQAIAEGPHPAPYYSLDSAAVLAAAESDPEGFVAGLEGPAIIDEVQRAPGLALAIKSAVDKERTPGRFLLTGSADVMALPRVADSLAGVAPEDNGSGLIGNSAANGFRCLAYCQHFHLAKCSAKNTHTTFLEFGHRP